MQRISAPGSKPGLERIKAVLNLLGNPEQKLPAVHVAGTNGKGSTSLMIADILSIAGYRVGRFISPHLHSYTERFLIDGQEIAWERFKTYLDQIEDCIPVLLQESIDRPTEFEILTAVAFLYFQDEKVDIAVLEVGMGGIYDSTNVIHPLAAVITSIDFDHTAFLGNTIEEIAMNKAGIIKPDIEVVVGEMSAEARQVICREARRQNAQIILSSSTNVQRLHPPTLQGQAIQLQSRYFNMNECFFSLLGDYQLKNLATAVTTLDILIKHNFKIYEEHVIEALAQFKMPGRMEVLQWQPLVIGDVAHNPQGAQALAQSLKILLPARGRVLLCGMLDDKDIAASLEWLGENTRAAVITRPASDRSSHWQTLAARWQTLYPHKEFYEVENITAAVKKSLELLREDEFLLITGSFYVMDEARRCFLNS